MLKCEHMYTNRFIFIHTKYVCVIQRKWLHNWKREDVCIFRLFNRMQIEFSKKSLHARITNKFMCMILNKVSSIKTNVKR